MKLAISTEHGNQLLSAEHKLSAIAVTLHEAMNNHRLAVEAIQTEADEVWQAIAAQYDIPYDQLDFQHVVLNGEHFVITQDRTTEDQQLTDADS